MNVTTNNNNYGMPPGPAGDMIDETITDVVDISVLASFEVEHVAGESDLVVELIDIYLDDAPQKLQSLKDAIAASDSSLLRNVAHSLKGSSSSLGAGRMATLCDELETTSSDLSPVEGKNLLTKLDHEFERVRLAFAAERDRRLSC